MSEPCQGCRCGCSPSDGDPQAAYDFTCEHCGCGPDMPWPPVPAAAVPEAQDGREWVSDECQHIDTCRMCEAPDECGCHCHAAIRASAAVREGERERLAAGWDRVLASLLFDSDPESVQQYRAGWEDCAKAVRAHLASLAAPEGTEQ